MKIEYKNDKYKPNFGIICPKCNQNNCVINARGEPVTINVSTIVN